LSVDRHSIVCLAEAVIGILEEVSTDPTFERQAAGRG
jgi:hypothetical protein